MLKSFPTDFFPEKNIIIGKVSKYFERGIEAKPAVSELTKTFQQDALLKVL